MSNYECVDVWNHRSGYVCVIKSQGHCKDLNLNKNSHGELWNTSFTGRMWTGHSLLGHRRGNLSVQLWNLKMETVWLCCLTHTSSIFPSSCICFTLHTFWQASDVCWLMTCRLLKLKGSRNEWGRRSRVATNNMGSRACVLGELWKQYWPYTVNQLSFLTKEAQLCTIQWCYWYGASEVDSEF